MRTIILIMLSLIIYCMPHSVYSATRFGESLCKKTEYHCITIRAGERWDTLLPNAEERDIVKRVNRMNVRLKPGMIIAIPNHLERLSVYDVAPFPRYVETDNEKVIYVSQKLLAWGAYDEQGELVWWGPLSSGKPRCATPEGTCNTPVGLFRIIGRQDEYCISSAFPRRANGYHGGAEMPYCMHFFRGYALHGSTTVPGYADSHGCLRLFIEDARWLNEEFIDLPSEYDQGTRVIIADTVAQ